MKDFLKSIRFKILIGVLVVLLAFVFTALYTGGFSLLASQALSSLIIPLQKLSSNISTSTIEFFERIVLADDIAKENEELRRIINDLNEQIIDYERTKDENEQYKEFLQIKEDYPDFQFEPSTVIGRDPNDRFFSFTIDKGSLHGVEFADPVITAEGLVGIIAQVNLSSAVVQTILDVRSEVGAYTAQTRDIGIVTGSVELAEQGLCKMVYIPRESTAKVGDIVATSGFGGVFPKDRPIGRIKEIKTESHGKSLYALIEPTADIKDVKDVFVIKEFKGQEKPR